MRFTTLRSTRTLPATGAALGLALTLGACGNSGDTHDSAPSVSQSTATGKPGATLKLRQACVSTNNQIVSTNATWNGAVDSHKADDMTKATSSMTSLAASLRKAGTDSGNATFTTKANAVATQVDTLKKSSKPSKTVNTTTYNDAVDDLTSYCSTMFPQATKNAA